MDLLGEVGRGLRLDVAFGRAAPALSARDRGFVHEILFGTLRLRGRLDHLLARHVHGGLALLEPRVLDVLRLGAYQILYMGGVPAYAAVSESVDLAGGRGPRGLVNAVLRAVARAGDHAELFPDPDADPEGFLATRGSHPRWLVRRWLARWPVEAVRALVDADNRRPWASLVPLDHTPEAAAALLAAAGIEAEPVGRGTGALRLEPGVDPVRALETIPAIMQDPAADLVVRYADPDPGMNVADLCAAPGGKALALSGRVLYTLAADRSRARLGRVRDNVRRTGRRLGLVLADGSHPPIRSVDMVLLDVPCTGTGTLARHPDARWRLDAGSVAELAEVQRVLLEAAADRVRPGGLLVYSTCTLEPEENETQVDAFLEGHPDYAIEATDAVPPEYVDGRGRLSVLPQDTGFDGAFAARMRRHP